MLVLLGSLAHNVVVWARQWLSSLQIQHCGILRMVRDVFHVSGLLRFDASGSVVEIVLNQQACLARSFICPLQALLASLRVVVIWAKLRWSKCQLTNKGVLSYLEEENPCKDPLSRFRACFTTFLPSYLGKPPKRRLPFHTTNSY